MRILSLLCLGSLALAVQACATQNSMKVDKAAECNAPTGWQKIAERAEGRVLFFGEKHGTNEIPDAFTRYVCAAASQGGSTLVMLEIPAGPHEEVMRDLSLQPVTRDVLLERMPMFWQFQDGRGSEAMMQMVLDLYAMSATGTDITILPMDSGFDMPETAKASPEAARAWISSQTREELAAGRERGMARSINQHKDAYNRTLVLVGNYHARKTPLTPDSKVVHAPALVEDSLSLLIAFGGGQHWALSNRSPNGEVRDVAAWPDAPAQEEMRWSETFAPAFDGYLYVGPVTVSYPVLPREAK